MTMLFEVYTVMSQPSYLSAQPRVLCTSTRLTCFVYSPRNLGELSHYCEHNKYKRNAAFRKAIYGTSQIVRHAKDRR
jgi:hypothetical protein